jgi:hypothetical protein
MMIGNNDNDKYNNVNDMSLSSLLGRAYRNGKSSDPLRSQPMRYLDCSLQQRRNRLTDLQDVIEQALQICSSDDPSLGSSDTLASRRNHQNKSGSSADSYSGSRANQ